MRQSGWLGHVAGAVARSAAVIAAILCFAAATMLSPAPRVPQAAAPNARDVQRGREAVLALAMVMFADGTPRTLRLSASEVEGMAALANHGLDWLRIRPRLEDEHLRVDASMRIADGLWVNLALNAVSSPGYGFPRIDARIGHLSLPDPLTRIVLRASIAMLARLTGTSMPTPEMMVQRFYAGEARGVVARLAIPRSLFDLGRTLVRPDSDAVDRQLALDIYGRLLAAELMQPSTSLADQVRYAFAGAAREEPVAYNRAAFVALAMFAVSPGAWRLADRTYRPPPVCSPEPPVVQLAGRRDLAMHFLLSAAMGAVLEPRFTRAVGEWQELYDSLPGGSGFSFVDLAADRAGLNLGRIATADPVGAARVAAALADTNEGVLFPARALGLAEGMTEAEFRRRFGSLDAITYAAAVQRIDRLLAGLPLYEPGARPS